MEKDISTIIKDLTEAERNFMIAMAETKKAVTDTVNFLNFIKGKKRDVCMHNWQRRRDGKQCANCHKVEFGEFSDAI